MKRLPNISPSLNSKSESGRGAGEKQDGKMVYLSAGISERERGHEGWGGLSEEIQLGNKREAH